MVEKTYTVIYHESSKKDLKEIRHYWENVLQTSADEFMTEVYCKTKALENFPFAHHQPNDEYLRQKGYRIIPVRNYYIFYVVQGSEIQIHRILYNKMDFSKLF